MGLKFRIVGLMLAACALTTTVLAIDYLRGTTKWSIAEIKGVTVESFERSTGGPFVSFDWVNTWEFKSNDENANAGTITGSRSLENPQWYGTWVEVECNTIYCEKTEGGYDSWYITFVNPKYFVAYNKHGEYYPLYRLGKAVDEPY